MRKIFMTVAVSLVLLFSLVFFSSAADNVGKITVNDSRGKTVATYDIVTDNPTIDARDIIEKALRCARDNATATDIYTVRLPKGEYTLFQNLNLYSNTVFDMGGSVLKRGEGCASMARFGEGDALVYGYEGYKNITVRNGTFDSDDKGGSSLFRFAHASNVEIDGVTFENSTDVMHLLTFAASENVRIRNCVFRDMTITDKRGSYNCEALQIDVLKEGYFSYPAQDGTPTRNVTVTGCTFENVPCGVGTHTAIAGHYFDGMVISGNTFRNITDYAVRALNYTNSEISSNIITDCGNGISCGTVTNSALSNFYAPMNGAGIRQNINVTVKNNSISLESKGDDDTSYGINLIGAQVKGFKDKDGKSFSGDCRISGVKVEGNSITSSVDRQNFSAVRISGAVGSAYGKSSNVSIENNKIVFAYKSKTKNTLYGIKAEDSEKVYFCGNSITDKLSNIHSCVTVNGCADMYFEKNTLSGASSFGIKLQNTTGATVVSNSISKTKSNSIYIFKGCKNAEVKSNKIKSCSGYGIAVSDGQVNSISSNSIYSCKKHSIYLTGKAKVKTVSSNYICGGKNTGVYLNKNASATTITKNIIDVVSKKVDGISINDKAGVANITSNKINAKTKKDSKKLKVKCRYGIRINSASCKIKKITGNTVNQCDNTGVYIAKAKTKAAVSKNTVKKARYGITYKKGKAKLSKNTFKSCSAAKTKVI